MDVLKCYFRPGVECSGTTLPLRATLATIAGEVSGRMIDSLKNPPGLEGGRGVGDNDGNGEVLMLQRLLNAIECMKNG